MLEDRKASLTAAFSQHLSIAQTEREYYLECCKRSASELAVCSGGAPRYAHYTFDFAEQLHLPHHSRQEGPLYFKVCRKVQLFGICCDSNNVQINYLVDESQTIGQNGTKSHGPNSVISMLDHYFSHHSLRGFQQFFIFPVFWYCRIGYNVLTTKIGAARANCYSFTEL